MSAEQFDHRFNQLAYSLREDPTGTGERWSVCNVCGCEDERPHEAGCPVDVAERGHAALAAERAAREAAERDRVAVEALAAAAMHAAADQRDDARTLAADALREGLAACEGYRVGLAWGATQLNAAMKAAEALYAERDTARADADRERRARETLAGAVLEERLAREESAAADCCLAEALNEAVAMRGRGTARRTTAARERVEAAHRREIAATAALDALLTGGEVGG